MAKAEKSKVVGTKLAAELSNELDALAEILATSKSALVVEALEAYMPMLRAGRRILRDNRLSHKEAT